MRDINTIYREQVAAANEEYTKTVKESVKNLGEEIRKAMEIFKIGMEKFATEITTASQNHLESVVASEVSWVAGAEAKIAQFEGVCQISISDGPPTPKISETVDLPEIPETVDPPKLPKTMLSVQGEETEDPIPSFLTRKIAP